MVKIQKCVHVGYSSDHLVFKKKLNVASLKMRPFIFNRFDSIRITVDMKGKAKETSVTTVHLGLMDILDT